MQETIRNEIKESIKVKNEVLNLLVPQIEKAAELMITALKNGNKILLFGNGGSAADAQHIAAELIGRYKIDRKSLAAIALSTDTSILTALANDFGFDTVFARQLEGLAKPGDIAVGISTSGNSKNVILGINKAREKGCKTVALLGSGGGQTSNLVDLAIIIPSKSTPRIQESHIMIGHILCDLIEKGTSSQ